MKQKMESYEATIQQLKMSEHQTGTFGRSVTEQQSDMHSSYHQPPPEGSKVHQQLANIYKSEGNEMSGFGMGSSGSSLRVE